MFTGAIAFSTFVCFGLNLRLCYLSLISSLFSIALMHSLN